MYVIVQFLSHFLCDVSIYCCRLLYLSIELVVVQLVLLFVVDVSFSFVDCSLVVGVCQPLTLVVEF